MTSTTTAAPLPAALPAPLPAARARLVPPALVVVALSTGMLVLAVVLGRPVLHDTALLGAPSMPWWALALAFGATEASVLHVQVNREARSISISELPLVLGLFFASPLALVVGRLVGSVLVLAFYRRSPLLKTCFNLALFAAEAGVALAIFSAIVPAGTTAPTPITWLAAYAATVASNAVGGITISLVISAYDGELRLGRLLLEAVTTQAAAPMVVTLALVAVTSLAAAPDSVWLLLTVGALLLVAYRAYAGLSDRHLNMERLYRFSQAVSSSPEVDEVLHSVLQEAKNLLRSERAVVTFVTSDTGQLARVRLGPNGRLTRSEDPRTPEDTWLIAQVVDRGAPLLVPRHSRDADSRRLLEQHGLREGLWVPLRGGAGVIGIIAVGDRMGDVRSFDDSDVLLLETVANHASVALQNGQLVGQLRHDALHDALTGLPNRAHLQRSLASVLDDVREGRSGGAAVLVLDLDEFKEVNDTLGHQQGDLLLIEVGTRLTTAVGSAGLVARLSGDEFAVLVPGTADESRALQLGRRLLRALEQPIALDGLEVEVGASLGVALAPQHATDPATLLRRADVAMYDAKTSTRRLRLYEPELDTSTPRRLTLVSELRSALQSGAIKVHVQPQALLSTGEVTGVEALVRWEHPELGSISPEEFIPVAERSGLIGPLTTRVLDASLGACAGWRAAGHDLGVAVNLSARSLHDADLVEEVARLLRRHSVPADRLTLEVTEGSVMADPARAIALLHELRELGVRLSVDDFGTGYSSLSYLKRLPVHEVKIDRSFVDGLREQGEDVAIVRAIIDLGRHLDLEVVAEGVENQQTWDLLARMGCDVVQGFHLARAMPFDQLLPWLAARPIAGAARGGLRAV